MSQLNLEKISAKQFMVRLLNGVAIAIVVALIPNAILGEVFKYFNLTASPLAQAAIILQFTTSLMAGIIVGVQFKFTPMQILAVGGATFLGSGAWKVIEVDGKNVYQLSGTGDLINVIIVAAIAVWVIRLLGHRFGSMSIILLPIVVTLGVGYLGLLILPYVSQVSKLIGSTINSFTVLAPLPMSVLICIAFGLIIVSPLSTVALGIAIGLEGVAAGASAMGLASTAAILVLGSLRSNKPGVPIAIFLGSIKMMMPNVFKNPVMFIPLIVNAIVSAIPVALLSISGTPQSSGFGFIGLIGPIASVSAGLSWPLAILCWFGIPFLSAALIHFLFTKVLKLYSFDIFKFETTH